MDWIDQHGNAEVSLKGANNERPASTPANYSELAHAGELRKALEKVMESWALGCSINEDQVYESARQLLYSIKRRPTGTGEKDRGKKNGK